jgi:heterodisulfide reductase subunit A
MTAALGLADQGYEVTLVEREKELGGLARSLTATGEGADPLALVRELVTRVRKNPRIEALTDHVVARSTGFVGNFRTTLASTSDPAQRLVEHGVTVVATGAREHRGTAFGLGSDPRAITQLDLEQILGAAERRDTTDAAAAGILQRPPHTIVMLQCVGPWDEPGDLATFYCSRICCSVATKNALRLKRLYPEASVYILYNRDIRTYGFLESLYTEARQAGVVYLRYEEGARPVIDIDGELHVSVRDEILGRRVALRADLLVLSAALIPAEGSRDLADLLKFSCTLDGFFLEAHVKLQPVEFPSEGIFLAGTAHYPKLLDEVIAQAGAAAARASSILSKDELEVGGVVAVADPAKCTGCLTCVRICPFNAAQINSALSGVGGIAGAAEISAAACRGCGLCAAECPAKAIQLQHFTDEQVLAKEAALFEAIDEALAG